MGLIIAIVIIVAIIVALIIILNNSSDSGSKKEENGKAKDKKEAKEVEWKDLKENQKYVIDGATIKCIYNSMPFGSLKVTANTVKLQDKNQATNADKKSENIFFLGLCMHPTQQKPPAPPPPCLGIIKLGNWKSFSDTKINNDNALLKKSTLPCLISNQDITIFHSGQKSEPPLQLPYIVKSKIKIKAKLAEYTVVLDNGGNPTTAYPILEFEITDGEPGYYIDVQVVRKNKSLLTNNKGIVDSWEKSVTLPTRMKKEAFSSWSNGDTNLKLDGSGKQVYKMPLEWWQDLARIPLANFTIMPICFKVSAFKNADDIVPQVETDSSDKMSVNVHNNLVKFYLDTDDTYAKNNDLNDTYIYFETKISGTKEMYAMVQWKSGGRENWDEAGNMTRPYTITYGIRHECYYPVRMIDWANTNPRYWDGNSQYKPGSTNIAFFEDRPNSVPPHPPLLKTFSHLDFLSNLHLNCDPPVTTINMQAGIPIGTIPNDISVLASRTWRLRVLQVRDKTTGSITITHPNAHP